MAAEVSHVRVRSPGRAVRAIVTVVLGSAVAAVPLLVHHGARSTSTRLVAAAVAGAAFVAVGRLTRSRAVAIVGAATALGAVWALTQARDGVLVPAIAVSGGAGAGLAMTSSRRRAGPRWATTSVVVIAIVTLSTSVAWTGANSPSAQWFGALVSHGPRTGNRVALTFDDGPNATATLTVRDILDRAGVKGTFFTVGAALDARPDLSAALLEDGHLLGNHSYHHDSFRWLDPRYPELTRTQRAFARRLGVCPALYRPPHGQHTPLMAHDVQRAGMTMVTWDVSAADWATDDAAAVARRVLRAARPGSIIDLHDGLDGHVDADRSVLVRALPRILDGLHRRGLQPVRLDVLLGRPGYLEHC